MAKPIHYQTANCTEFFITEIGTNDVIKISNFSECLNAIMTLGILDDVVFIFVVVVFVFNISNDLLKNVFNRNHACHAAIFIDNNGNVLSSSLTRSSGSASLDQEAVAAVRRSSPVPAPPADAGKTITVPFSFTLR